ncbi:hypothetical protein THAOC_30427, partial [Thalassiosira oceanica]
MPTPRQGSGPSLCLADCDDNDHPVPIQQQVQLLALDDKAVKKKQEANVKEQKSVMSFVEEDTDRAPIPIQQQMQHFDDVKEKTTSEISTVDGVVSGICERDSTTELTAEEMEEGEVNLGPSVASRVGESWGELEACVEVSSMPTPRNDAADARLAPEEEIPIYDGIVVPTVWTRLQTGVEHVWKRKELTEDDVEPASMVQPFYRRKGFVYVMVAMILLAVGIAVAVPLLSNPWTHQETDSFAPQPTTSNYQAKLLAPDGAADDSFGGSVAIYGDTIIVGSDEDDDNGLSSGSAHVLVRSGEEWTHQAKLLAPDGAG